MASYLFKEIENPDDLVRKSESDEFKYWKKLKFGSVQKFSGPVVALAHAHKQYVVGTQNRLHLYKTRSDKLVSSFGRFKTNIRCCSFRGDGELLSAADESGVIRVFNMSSLHSKASLRLFRGHSGPVSSICFTISGAELISGGHDGSVRIWDLPTQAPRGVYNLTSKGRETSEQVRALAVSHRSPHLTLAGGFDGIVRLFDLRQAGSNAILTLEHGPPITSIALSPSDSLVIATGGRKVGVWALHGGSASDPIANLDAHHKTTTCVQFGREGARFLSAGLDGLVKVHDVSTCEEVHQWEISSRLITMSLAEGDSSLLLGGDDGLLHTRRPQEMEEFSVEGKVVEREEPLPSSLLDRAIYDEEKSKELLPIQPPPHTTQREKKKHALKVLEQRAKLRKFVEKPGMTFHPAMIVAAQHYTKQDKHLMRFQHTQALLTVLRPLVRHNYPERTLAVMQELIRRRVLKSAIAGQEARTGLSALLLFIRRNIWRPAYSTTLQHVLQCIIDTYGHGRSDVLEENEVLRAHISYLERTMLNELKFTAAARIFRDLAVGVIDETDEMDTS